MIQMMTAFTTEVDEIDDAMGEMLGQLNLDSLKKNSAGIFTCHFDFIETGFVKEMARRLPFDTIGMTTMASANRRGMSMYGMSLAVLTSDDVIFESAVTGPLTEPGYAESMSAAYAEAKSKLPGDPSLVITFFPYTISMSDAKLIDAFDRICGGVPFWGSATTSTEMKYEQYCAVRNGGGERGAMAMLLMHGPVSPEFVVVSVPERNIRDNRGIITESGGCVLKRVNGLPVMEYLKNMGIVLLENSATVTPFMVYYEGSAEPVAIGVFNINEDGSLLCGGNVPEGAGISVGEITADVIMATAEAGIRRITQSGRSGGALMFPCVTRYVILPDHNGEMELAARIIGEEGAFPYMIGYSGGEVCPVPDAHGRLRNRFHNYTFSACVF